MKGLFIALEGSEGTGKSTQRELLSKYLKEKGFTVVQTREPGGTPLAEDIRAMLLTPREEHVHKKTELALFFAARVQHTEMVIKPAIERGEIVICDRWLDSTYAYQLAGRGIPRNEIDKLASWAVGDFRPNLTYLFRLDPETGMARAAARGKPDRMEGELMDFFHRVADGYMAQYELAPERYGLIDASGTIGEVWELVKGRMDKLLEDTRPKRHKSSEELKSIVKFLRP